MTDAPHLPGFEHRHVDANGVRLHYVVGGDPDGVPLVLVHGWPQHHGMWRHLAPRLAESFRVHALDLRGHGWSEVPEPGGDAYDKRTLAADVAGFVGALGLDRPVLVGHDWGGWTSLLVAARRPELVRGVVAFAISAPWTKVPLRALPSLSYQVVAGGPWGRFTHQGLDQRFLRTIYRLGAGRGPRLDDVEQYLERYRDRDRARAGAAMYRRFMTSEAPAVMRGRYVDPATQVPILLVPGRGDAVLTPRLVAPAATAPNVSMHVVDGAGHWVPEQQPEESARLVREFVEGIDAS